MFFRERWGERAREGEKHCLPPRLGTQPESQACALSGHWTGRFWICGVTRPSEPHQSGLERHILKNIFPFWFPEWEMHFWEGIFFLNHIWKYNCLHCILLLKSFSFSWSSSARLFSRSEMVSRKIRQGVKWVKNLLGGEYTKPEALYILRPKIAQMSYYCSPCHSAFICLSSVTRGRQMSAVSLCVFAVSGSFLPGA